MSSTVLPFKLWLASPSGEAEICSSKVSLASHTDVVDRLEVGLHTTL